MKKISMTKYNKIMDKIIAKNKSVPDTLVEMLQEALRYGIIKSKKEKKK